MSSFKKKFTTSAKDCLEKLGSQEISKAVLGVINSEITDSKQFITSVKQLLQLTSQTDVSSILYMLVPLYLSLEIKNAAKKVLSSFFQSLEQQHQDEVRQLLCQEMQQAFAGASFQDEMDQAPLRHVVDNLVAFLDNFALGELCAREISCSALMFLSRSQVYFFHHFRQGGHSVVRLNSLMHDCHVTMQMLNRLTQKLLTKDPQHLQHHLQEPDAVSILQTDVFIILDDQMMIDCRCCSAINLVLLLQSLAPAALPTIVKNSLQTRDSALLVVEGPTWLETIDLLQLRLSSVPPMAALSLLWGMLGMLSSPDLAMETVAWEPDPGEAVMDQSEETLLFEIILYQLLDLDVKCQTTASRVQCIKTVTMWTGRMINTLKEITTASMVCEKLIGKGEIIQRLLNFVWTHWQDQLDVVRQNSRIVFDNCLKLHVLASHCDSEADDLFLLSVMEHVMELSWSSHSKLAGLSSLARCMGPSPLLRAHPELPTALLAQLTDQALACHASELYEVLIDQETKNNAGMVPGASDWMPLLINPVISLLCSASGKHKQHIIEYILPKVMKKDRSVMEYMLNKLSSSEQAGKEQLGALIVCLRQARAWGLMSDALQQQQVGAAALWTKILRALNSSDEQVRLDAFALLCESRRTAEPISKEEFRHVQHFITYNLNNQSPAFRQTVLSLMKKFFFRINESQQGLLRTKKKKKIEACGIDVKAALETYRTFLSWLENFLFTQLYPSSAFARRTISLSMLSMMSQDIQTGKNGDGYHPLKYVAESHVHTLLECLTDTFEENKQEAYKLLMAVTSIHPHLLAEDKCLSLYTAALQLAVSTRPQDSGTAAYIFKLLLGQPCFVKVLQSHTKAAAGPRLLLGMGHKCEQKWPALAASLSAYTRDMEALGQASGELQLLWALLLLLMEQVLTAHKSLILAAANCPMYPTLHSLLYVLDCVDFQSAKTEEILMWKIFLQSLLQVCLQVAVVVSPVVQNSSPEGNVPEEAILGPGLKFDLELIAEVEKSRQTVELMPEYLVVCCWRSIKEVSLLLGQLCLRVPVSHPLTSDGLLSISQIEEIGQYFKQQLMESLHRGAFELAYAGFVMMCRMLWNSPLSCLQKLPQRWLEDVMVAIASPQESSSLCATRRSAGVPFFVQAIVATETESSQRPSFHKVMKTLLQLAFGSTLSMPPSDTKTDAQVHALNILRALYKDTRLGEDVVPYICDGLNAAILGFKSQFWEVRNSSTLLLSALMTRIFGVKRSKDEAVLSKRNSQTGRAFFHKYPSLYPFLLSELEEATQNLGSSGQLHLHPSLYPVLMVLGHLFPSTMEGTSTRLNLAAFIPYVIRCSSSPVYKTRMMAARALPPLSGKEQLADILTTLFNALPVSPAGGDSGTSCQMPHSHIHGILLQIYHLLVLTEDLSCSILHKLTAVCAVGWTEHLWLITKQNPCLCSRKVALGVTDLIMQCETKCPESSIPKLARQKLGAISQHLCYTLQFEIASSCQGRAYSPHIPFLSEFLTCVATLAMKYLISESGTSAKFCIPSDASCADGSAKTGCLGADSMKPAKVGAMALKLLSCNVYEVDQAVIDMLLLLYRKASATGDVLPNNLNTEHRNWDVRHGTDVECSGSQNADVPSELLEKLLSMGLERGTHAETVLKIFQFLYSIFTEEMISPNIKVDDVFAELLQKILSERRADVKSSLIQFTGKLFPLLYDSLCQSKGDKEKVSSLLHEWRQLLQDCCSDEQPNDLHLSCVRVLQDNAALMLVDSRGCLGPLVFDFWSLLVTLLQDDDLEVKEVGAFVFSIINTSTGEIHAEQALEHLVGAMFKLHGNIFPQQCLAVALTWMMPNNFNEEAGVERLFDKGELNTFEDKVALSRTICKLLRQSFAPEVPHFEPPRPGNPTQPDQKVYITATPTIATHSQHLPQNHNFSHTQLESGSLPTMHSLEHLKQIVDSMFDLTERLKKLHGVTGYLAPSGRLSDVEPVKLDITSETSESHAQSKAETVTVNNKIPNIAAFAAQAAEPDPLRAVFLTGSAYCGNVVCMIRLALVVQTASRIPDLFGLQPSCGKGFREAVYKLTHSFKELMSGRNSSSNYLLKTLVQSL